MSFLYSMHANDLMKYVRDIDAADGFERCTHSPNISGDLKNLCKLSKASKLSEREMLSLLDAYFETRMKNEYCEMFIFGSSVFFLFNLFFRHAAKVQTHWDGSESFTFTHSETDEISKITYLPRL